MFSVLTPSLSLVVIFPTKEFCVVIWSWYFVSEIYSSWSGTVHGVKAAQGIILGRSFPDLLFPKYEQFNPKVIPFISTLALTFEAACGSCFEFQVQKAIKWNLQNSILLQSWAYLCSTID